MKIDFANLNRQYKIIEKELLKNLQELFNSCKFILGDKVSELEKKLAEFCSSKFCIGVSSGTDALLLSLLAFDIKPGDEVITTPFTFIATAEVVSLIGAIPVFVDIEEKSYNINPELIEDKITDKTKAIIAVNLYGQPADFNEINKIASKYNLPVIEDAAQSFGAKYFDKISGNLADIGCTSFFPAKPLGCYGDGGAVFTNDEKIYEKVKALRVHGQIKRYMHKYIGINGRLDSVQAVVLLEKLKIFSNELLEREKIAQKYFKLLKNNKNIILPEIKNNRNSTWAQFSIRTRERERLKEYLNENGIPTAIHYPVPLHLQECFKYLNYKKRDFPVAEKIAEEILSLPMNPYLKNEEIEYICYYINNFFN